MRGAFSDLHFAIQDMIAEQDRVVTRYLFSGVHQGEFMGAPATGKSVTLSGIWIHRLANGRIVEGREWGQWDALGFLQQVGAVA
jgi:steroid delta-isomerase-like uncharacterized protein